MKIFLDELALGSCGCGNSSVGFFHDALRQAYLSVLWKSTTRYCYYLVIIQRLQLLPNAVGTGKGHHITPVLAALNLIYLSLSHRLEGNGPLLFGLLLPQPQHLMPCVHYSSFTLISSQNSIEFSSLFIILNDAPWLKEVWRDSRSPSMTPNEFEDFFELATV